MNLFNFIAKDTSGKNESKTVVVIIRILLITSIVYFVANAILWNITLGNIQSLLFYGIFLLLFLGIFGISYRYSTRVTLRWFTAGMICWVISSVHYFGWDTGVQHFLILLLVLYFFSSYKHYLSKFLFAIGLCVLRMILFYIYHNREPLWEIGSLSGSILQIINTVTIFWGISVISYICSKDSQELEGKLIEYNNQLQKQANTDTLTGLYNRRKAMEYLNEMVKYPEVHGSFCLCICDIDFFKKVNDNYGHDFGDEVLKNVSSVFRKEMEKNFAARWGGEEFLLVFPKCNGDEAYIKLEQIQRKIRSMRTCKGDLSVGITMTFGLTEYDFFHGLEATIKEADQKLYMGKEKGRDVIIF